MKVADEPIDITRELATSSMGQVRTDSADTEGAGRVVGVVASG